MIDGLKPGGEVGRGHSAVEEFVCGIVLKAGKKVDSSDLDLRMGAGEPGAENRDELGTRGDTGAEKGHQLVFSRGLRVAVFEDHKSELPQQSEVVRAALFDVGIVVLERLGDPPFLHEEEDARRGGVGGFIELFIWK